MSNMTPFEISLELLKLSKDMISEDYFARRAVSENNWQTACENARQRGEPLPPQPDLPAYPSETEIIAKAQTLNGFVSQIPQFVEKPSKK